MLNAEKRIEWRAASGLGERVRICVVNINVYRVYMCACVILSVVSVDSFRRGDSFFQVNRL